MRIVSYNIRKAVGLDWRRDPFRIAEILREIDADIVVLQEADRRIGERAGVLPLDHLEHDHGYQLVALANRPKSHGWHGNAILHKKQLQTTTSERVEIPIREPRGAVSAVFNFPNIEIIGTHLGLTPAMRKKQFRSLAVRMSQHKRPTILAGDFNQRKIGADDFGSLVDIISPGPSFHAARPRAMLDRFALSKGVRVTSSHVHSSDLAQRASDHLPIVLDFEIEESTE